MNPLPPAQRPKTFQVWESFALVALGTWLVAGGGSSIFHRKWALWLPPQFDVLGLIGAMTSEVWVAYVGGGLLIILGVGMVAVAIWAVVKQHAT